MTLVEELEELNERLDNLESIKEEVEYNVQAALSDIEDIALAAEDIRERIKRLELTTEE